MIEKEFGMERPNWKRTLADILRERNACHGRRDKTVSNLTMQHRRQRLFSCFTQLRDLGFRIEDPRNLKEKHVQALVEKWVGEKKSPATIQTWLSHLRIFADWIGKPGLVKTPTAYVEDEALVRRQYAATTDGSWSTNHVDIAGVLQQVYAVDPFVGDQLLAEALFGLRVKEAIMLKPWRDDKGETLDVIDGTKGGRPRAVPIHDPLQRQALNTFKQRLRSKRSSLADPRLNLEQALTRYYTVMRRIGITKSELGVTSHGLRKEFANHCYLKLAGVLSPIQGGQPIDRETDRVARESVAQVLGHGREQVSNAYLGGVLRSPRNHGQRSITVGAGHPQKCGLTRRRA